MLVGGRTGSGKTTVVRSATAHVDLEQLANHRGSAFGGHPTPQPPPVAFENALAVALLRLPTDATLVLEDESRTIGRLALPQPLFGAMQEAAIFVIEADDETRAAHIYDEYVRKAVEPRPHLTASLARIKRRLGGARYAEIKALMDAAFDGSTADGTVAWPLHRRWIIRLLRDYYDPMYDYQIAGKEARVRMRGTAAEVAAALTDRAGVPAVGVTNATDRKCPTAATAP